MNILYDLTRMVAFMDRAFPSGIERADVNYLAGLLEDGNFNIEGVFEKTLNGLSYLIYLPNSLVRKIHSHLYSKWIDESVNEAEFTRSKSKLEREIRTYLEGFDLFSENRIDKKIYESINSAQNIIYLNCNFAHFSDPSVHSKLVFSLNIKLGYIVYDIIPIEFPEYAPFPISFQNHLNKILMCKNPNVFMIADSEIVRLKVLDLLEGIGIANKQIFANHLGVEKKFIDIQNKNQTVRKNQFVIVSTIEPRKNHDLLLNVWKKIIRQSQDLSSVPKLIIIGRRGWSNSIVKDTLDRNEALRQFVIEKNDATDSEIITDIKESLALLFPTFDEGWGLPVVESLALGTPVICSDIAVLRECSQAQATFIDPIDGIGWYNIISDVASGKTHLTTGDFRPNTWNNSIAGLKKILLERLGMDIAIQKP